MEISILNGMYTGQKPGFRRSYPVNMIPVPVDSGISQGYLRPADGVVEWGNEGPGIDRGGINWNNECYRVMGTKLVLIGSDGSVKTLGDVGGDASKPVSFDYSFDRLAVSSVENLFYWDTYSLAQVTDTDLGKVKDFVWINGYFMTTDGTSLVVTELDDPMSVNPLKYASSEADPDPIIALIRLRNEVFALNRYTVEVFQASGEATGFPFVRVEGAQSEKGCVGVKACCEFMDRVAFVGGGRNESTGVYMTGNGVTDKISTWEVDHILSSYSDQILATVHLETRVEKGHYFLFIHLPDRTLLLDGGASNVIGQAVWVTLISSTKDLGQYRIRNLVRCYNKWLVGDPQSTKHGYITDEVSSHWGRKVRWEFGTDIIYNAGNGAIFHELELVALTGRIALGDDPQISTAYSVDGEHWSQEHYIHAGKRGETLKRLVWRRQGLLRNWRIQRFSGDSAAHIAFVRLEARVEPLAR